MRLPRTGMRMGSSRERSNQAAYGESGPSRSTDHRGRLCQPGVGTAMWLGTMSTTTPIPWASASAARDSSCSRPPMTAETLR